MNSCPSMMILRMISLSIYDCCLITRTVQRLLMFSIEYDYRLKSFAIEYDFIFVPVILAVSYPQSPFGSNSTLPANSPACRSTRYSRTRCFQSSSPCRSLLPEKDSHTVRYRKYYGKQYHGYLYPELYYISD